MPRPARCCARAPRRKQHPGTNLLMGGAAGTIAATVCYPLDTIRRRMQMKGTMYSGQVGGQAVFVALVWGKG